MAHPDQSSPKRGRVSVAIAQVRDELRFMVRRMATPIEPHEASVKAQLNKVARLTGLPPRRLKDFRNGYLNKIPAHQDHTIRAAYRKWLEASKARALADLRGIEEENDRLQKSTASYVSSSWRRACEAGAEDRALGGAAAGTANDS